LISSLSEKIYNVQISYLKLINAFKEKNGIKCFLHNTGGEIVVNTIRILPEGLSLKSNWDSWDVLPVFELIKETGNINDEEMRKVFNLGIGLIAIVSRNNQNEVLKIADELGEKSFIIGEVV